MKKLRSLADPESAELSAEGVSSVTAVIPRDLIWEALAELIRNALEAPRPKRRHPAVSIVMDPSAERGIEIRVIDNGTGIGGYRLGAPLSTIESTKGRPAEGLVTSENAIRASRGTIAVERSDMDGTVVVVTLPRGARKVED